MKSLTDLTTQCIRCGFCLEACPTFLITGEETESPRGRIYLVRSAEEGKLGWNDVRPHISACLGCRACETVCPSGVQYGEIFELARDRLEREKTHFTKKGLLKTLSSPKLMRLQLLLGKLLPGKRIPTPLSKLLSGQMPEADKPEPQPKKSLPPLDERLMPPVKGEVYMLEGCVMRVLYPRVHQCTRRLLRRLGYVVKETKQGCCGSLHLHAGYLDEARSMGIRLVSELSENLPILVNSAGCGSTMKEYPKLMGNDADWSQFSSRVLDISEFLFAQGLPEALSKTSGLKLTATYHDPCHLLNGQGVAKQPRQLLAAIPQIKLVELNESEVCCGSAGIYNLTQPHLARELLERKWANVAATGARVVATGNPGCQAWITQAAKEHGQTVQVLHTAELLEAAFIGIEPFLD